VPPPPAAGVGPPAYGDSHPPRHRRIVPPPGQERTPAGLSGEPAGVRINVDAYGATAGSPSGSVSAPAILAAPGQPGMPRCGREGPLPRDGLFVRRNNAFGTRLAHGVADLIEQGVLVDQEQIRFDDFVAANVDDISPPPAGTALAVRHGWTAAPGDNKARSQ